MIHYKDNRTKELPHCPYCGSECSIEIVDDPFGHIEHTMIGCTYCLCISVSDEDALIREDMGNDWYDIMTKMFIDLIDREKLTEHYQIFLQDMDEYERKTGHKMPIWYGICGDYLQMENGRLTHEQVLSGLNNGLSKFEREVWLEERNFRMTHPRP